MDFSSAGYRAGSVKLPSAIAAQRLIPASGDNTARIQAALDNPTGVVLAASPNRFLEKFGPGIASKQLASDTPERTTSRSQLIR
jgi:hypothetical protein